MVALAHEIVVRLAPRRHDPTTSDALETQCPVTSLVNTRRRYVDMQNLLAGIFSDDWGP
jgi:hypothetical protein